MMENAAVLEYGRNMSVETLNDIEAAQNITIEKQQNALGAQQDELNEKKLELATITEECYYMQDTLKQRQKTIAEMYDVVKAETSLLNEQRKVLSVSCLFSKFLKFCNFTLELRLSHRN